VGGEASVVGWGEGARWRGSEGFGIWDLGFGIWDGKKIPRWRVGLVRARVPP